ERECGIPVRLEYRSREQRARGRGQPGGEERRRQESLERWSWHVVPFRLSSDQNLRERDHEARLEEQGVPELEEYGCGNETAGPAGTPCRDDPLHNEDHPDAHP